jgi:FHA domain
VSPPRKVDWTDYARRMSREEFTSANPYWFLVGRRQMLPPTRRHTGLYSQIRDNSDTGERPPDVVLSDEHTAPLGLVCPIAKRDGSTEGEITVGRTDAADVVIADTLISRTHASFRVHVDRVELRDAGSANGTFVDGNALSGEAARTLRAGAVVRFSHVEFELLDAGGAWERLRGGLG